MSEVRLIRGDEFEAYARMTQDAYPAMFPVMSEEQRRDWLERLKRTNEEEGPVKHYGCYRGGEMVGGMRLHEFTMTVFEARLPVEGVGNVFVDLAHRREHVSRDMMQWFHARCLERGAPLAVLYPFRPDFYRAMGYGYGPKMNKYRFRPGDLPRGGRENVTWMNEADAPLLLECYNAYARRTHGMIDKQLPYFERLLRRMKVAGYVAGGRVEGFIAFSFKKLDPDHVLRHDLEVHTLVYLRREALGGLMGFLGSQLDQVERVTLCSMDDDLHFLPRDPRDGEPRMFYTSQETNLQGLGIMYRVVDTRGLFRMLGGHSFGGASLRLKLNVLDTFLPSNSGGVLIHFKEGKPTVLDGEECDVEATLNVEWLSSLVMGVVGFRKLWTYGLLEVSDEGYLDRLDALFHVPVKPVTVEEF